MDVALVSSRLFEGCLGNLRLKSIVDLVQDRPSIGEKGRSVNSIYVRARFIFNALNNFIASADPQISVDHIDDFNNSTESSSQIVLTEKEKIVKKNKRKISVFFRVEIENSFFFSCFRCVEESRC